MSGPLVPHVMVIALENHSYTGVIGNSNFPQITALSQAYGTCTNFYAISHPSLPNYLAFASGDNQGVCDDHDPSSPGIAAANLFSSLDTAGIAWKCYCESIPSAGYLGGDTGLYAARHNPVVYFRSFRSQTAAFQQAHLVNYPTLSANLTAGSAPPFCFVVPNVTHDGHSDPSNTCDGFVSGLVSTVQASTWYTQNNGVIVLWWDEDHPDTNIGIGDQTACTYKYGGHIACVVISAANHGSAPFTSNVNHYGFLRALEKLYGLPFLGKSAHTVNGDLSPLLSVNIGGSVSVSPSALTFNAVQGGSTPPSQSVQLTNTTGSVASYTTVSSAPTWLAVSPTSGSVAASGGSITSTINVTTGSLAAGTYSGTITYSGTFGSLIVSVSFVVAAGGSVSVSPSTLTFNAVQGGSNPSSKTVTLSNTTGSAASYSAVSSAAWLSVSPTSGSIAGSGGTVTSTISATLGTLSAGSYSGTITYSGSFGSLMVSVSLVVAPVGNATTSNLGNGFLITAPADTNPRTLKIYTDVNQGIATLAASLSDSSAPDFYDSNLQDSSGGIAPSGVYMLSYVAGSAGQTLSVSYTLSDNSIFGTTSASDTFTRANQSNLGTASDGQTWTLVTESGSPVWSIAGNIGKLTGMAGDTGVALLGSHTLLDCEVVGIVNLSDTASSAGLILRANSGGTTYYRASLWGSAIFLYYVTGGVSTLLSIQPATFKANTNYWLRFRACKSSLYARYWQSDGSVEPQNWHIFVTDTTLSAPGKFGMRGMLGADADILLYDTFSASDLSATGDSSYVSLYAADLPTDVVVVPGSGSLVGSVTTPTGAFIDLTAEGTGDWAHWGLTSATSFDHKAGVPQIISTFTSIGSGVPVQNTSGLLGYSWTDGTPDQAATKSTTESDVQGVANGYSLVVPADTTSRALNVYVSATKAQGELTATLSDGSASAYSDSSINDSGSGSAAKYTLVYNAGSDNQTLTAQWTMLADNGAGAGSTSYSSDTFTRANQSGWGTASGGETYTTIALAGSPVYSIVSNKGQITASALERGIALLGTQRQANAETLIRWQMSSVLDSISLVLRCDAIGKTYYRADLFNGTTLNIDRVIGGAVTTLKNTTVAFSAHTPYWLRFRLDGSNLYARFWADGGTEPPTWTATVTDSSTSAITGAGQWGIRSHIATGGDILAFDSYTVTSVPTPGTPGAVSLHSATVPGVGVPPPPPPPPPPPGNTVITVKPGDAVTPKTWLGLGVQQDASILAPLASYPLDEASGTIAHDTSGNSYDATLSGSLTYGRPGAPINSGDAALGFGSASVLILPPQLPISAVSGLSLAFWINVTSGWQYVVVTYASDHTITLFLNGAPYDGSGSGDLIMVSEDLTLIGSMSAGDLDEVKLYPYVLSDAQIATSFTTNAPFGLSDDQRALVNTRLNFMSPSLIRTCADAVSWWCPTGTAGTYDFGSALMQEWYRVFDNAQQQNYSVIVGVNSPAPFSILSSGWCTAFADLVDYLINTLGYTCIRYVSGVSEPDTF